MTGVAFGCTCRVHAAIHATAGAQVTSQLTFDSHSGATDPAMHRDARAGLPPRPSVVQKYLDIIAAVPHSQVTAVAALCSKDAAKAGVAVSVKLLVIRKRIAFAGPSRGVAVIVPDDA